MHPICPTQQMRSLLNKFYIRRTPIMKKSIPPIENLGELNWRYDVPIPREPIATIKCGSLAGANMRRATANLRLLQNYIIGGIAAYRAVATPKCREQIKRDVRTTWPRYWSTFRGRNTNVKGTPLSERSRDRKVTRPCCR